MNEQSFSNWCASTLNVPRMIEKAEHAVCLEQSRACDEGETDIGRERQAETMIDSIVRQLERELKRIDLCQVALLLLAEHPVFKPPVPKSSKTTDDFRRAYQRLSEHGICDAWGGMESQRVLNEWVADGRAPDIDAFIAERANVGPHGDVPSKEAITTLLGWGA